jgi:hypothetical protein
MPRASYLQRSEQIVRFLVALRDPKILRVLSEAGFTDEEYEEGWRRLRAIGVRTTKVRPAAKEPETLDALLDQLSAWIKRWFPITEAALRHHHPELVEPFFEHLPVVRGMAAIIAAGKFIGRLRSLDEKHPEARALLRARGLDDAEVTHARALVERAERFTPPPRDEDLVDDKAVDRAWAWYVEWTAIARATVKDRPSLRNALGTPRAKRKSKAPATPG